MTLSVSDLESELSSRGLSRRAQAHGEPPLVLVTSDPVDGVDGRYFPSRNAVLVRPYRGRPEVTRALVNHEVTHAAQYARRCGGTCPHHRRKCGYVGQHDAAFYRDLERMHREAGVSLRSAMVVEIEAGYGRDVPRSWRERKVWG